MKEILSNPVTGVAMSLAAYLAGMKIKEKFKLEIFNPLLLAIIILIITLSVFKIDYEDYNEGGKVISFFLGPATVALALPLYKKFELFKKNAVPILAGIVTGIITGILTIAGLSKLFNLTEELKMSLIPKSITTPIAMVLSEQLGGYSSITVAAVIITGILGAVLGPVLTKVFKIKDKVAVGIAMGNASHAVGTSKAMEMGETEGAMGSLTIALAGIITVLIAPFIINLIG